MENRQSTNWTLSKRLRICRTGTITRGRTNRLLIHTEAILIVKPKYSKFYARECEITRNKTGGINVQAFKILDINNNIILTADIYTAVS